jgi:hypothetical protein
MRSGTAGQIAVSQILPPDIAVDVKELDKQGIAAAMDAVATKYPERYRDITKQLMDLGRITAYRAGGFSFDLGDLSPGQSTLAARARIRESIAAALDEPDRDKRRAQIDGAVDLERDRLTKDLMAESVAANNPFGMQVLSGSRGNPTNLRSLRGFDGAYEDHHGNRIPLPILQNYSEGLPAASYFAGTFGARKGVLDVKACLSGDTRVLMADFSERRIADIEPGMLVFGADTNGRMRPVRVVRRYDNGVKLCHKWQFRVGSAQRFVDVVATADHQILSEVRAGRPGSTYAYRSDYTPRLRQLGTSRPQKNPTKTEFTACPARGCDTAGTRTEPLALLYGLLLGDGCCTSGWGLSCGDQQLIDDTAAYLRGFGITLNPPQDGYTWRLANETAWAFERTPTGQITGSGNPHYRRLTELGVRCLAHHKHLAAEVDSWDNASVAAMIGGLFAADGCVEVRSGGVTLRLAMTAQHVVENVKRILEQRFGVWAGTTHYVPLRGNMRHPQWAFYIAHQECVRRFCETIPLVGVKRAVLQAAVAATVPQPRNERLGFKLYSKELVGEIPTFDLEVDHPDHMFVLANGLVVSNSTADAGYAAKQLIQGNHRLVVTDLDDENDLDNANVRGLPTRTDDNENVGSLLAVATGGYPRNTELTPKILAELRRNGVEDILVRSPVVGGPADGGVYARDIGMRERGGLAPRGDFIGHAAGQAVSEKLTQMQLSSKHSGGVAGAGPVGFPLINQLLQVPESFRGGSAHAQADGTVGAPKTAPQGGYYIDIGGKEHYVNPEQTLLFKPGDTVEAGDVLTTGIPNPAEIVRHKGIGEGRRYFVDALRGALKQSGTHVARRNLEVLGRGLINHVRMTDLVDDYAPDDIVPYHTIERNWQPRPGAVTVAPSAAVGQYLERPTLHYTIGTRITKNMVPKLSQFGVNTLTAHRDPPPFEPEMQRAAAAVSTDPDWQVRMLGSGQKGSLLDAAHRGASSDEAGTSFVPAMIRGENFGVVGPTTGR